MTGIGSVRNLFPAIGGLRICAWAVFASTPTTQIATGYPITTEAPIDSTIRIYDSAIADPVLTGGWVKGPTINGKFVTPAGDWTE